MGRQVRVICVGPHCFVRPVAGGYFCVLCWGRVPGELRDRIAETWSAGRPSDAHQRAIVDAVRALSSRPMTD